MKTPKRPAQTPEERRHARLGWMLLEWKIMYYYPEMIAEELQDGLTVDDEIFDQYELEYLHLCVKLGKENTISHKYGPDNWDGLIGEGMQEVDFGRPSVQLVLSKYGVKQKKGARQ
jgi:hypothetical protein